MVSYAHSPGGPLIGFTSLFILGVILGLAWIGLTESADPKLEGSDSRSENPNRTHAVAYALTGGLIVARLVFVGLHQPYYDENPLEIIALWQGGLSATGGVIGAILGVIAFTWRDRRYLWTVLDDLAIPALMLSLSAWIGCWLDGVAYGKQVPLNWIWLMNSDPFRSQIARWPTQMVGLLLSLITFLILYRVSPRLPVGVMGTLAFTGITLTMVVVGFFRADPSMLIIGQRLDVLGPAALVIIGLGLTSYCWFKGRNSRR